MKASKLAFVIITVVMILATSISHKATQAATDNERIAITLVIDESGSMAKNDPRYLRNTAIRLFTALLDENDEIGIIRFSTEASFTTDGLEVIKNFDQQKNIIDNIKDEKPGGYTDIQKAICLAQEAMTNSDADQKFIVMLSDGQAEVYGGIPGNYNEDTLHCMQSLDTRFYGIAFTKSGESNLLYDLAEASNPTGKVIFTESALDLANIYLEIISEIKDRIIVSPEVTDNSTDYKFPLSPELNYYVENATYIYIGNGALYNSLNHSEGMSNSLTINNSDFSVYKVEDPFSGLYTFEKHGTSSFACVIYRSKLNLRRNEIKSHYAMNYPIRLEIILEEQTINGNIRSIGDTFISARVIRPDGTIDQIDQLSDSGQNGDKTAFDGIFTAIYPRDNIPGTYTIIIDAYKGSLPLSTSFSIYVEEYPSVEFIQPSEKSIQITDQDIQFEIRFSTTDFLTFPQSIIPLTITTPSGKTQIIEMTRIEDTPYNFLTTFLPSETGLYKFTIDNTSIKYKNNQYPFLTEKELLIDILPQVEFSIPEDTNPSEVESEQLSNGLSVKVDIKTNQKLDSVFFQIVGLPENFSLTQPFVSLPSGTTSLPLIIQGEVNEGSYSGFLLLSSEDDVEILTPSQPFTINVCNPEVVISFNESIPESIKEAVVQSEGIQIDLLIASTSNSAETLSITLENESDFVISPKDIELPPNSEQVYTVTITPNKPLNDITEQINFSMRKGIVLVGNQLPLSIEITTPTWIEKWGFVSGSSTMAISLVLGYLLKKIKKAAIPTGTAYFKDSNGIENQIHLSSVGTGIFTKKVVVGSKSHAGIRLHGDNLKRNHAEFIPTTYYEQKRIGRTSQTVKIEKHGVAIKNINTGRVQVGNTPIQKGQASQPLKNGSLILIGSQKILYKN